MKRMLLLIVVLAICSQARAADAAKLPPRSDGPQLRGAAASKLDDDYDRALLGDADRPNGEDRPTEEMQKRLRRQLGAAAQPEDQPKSALLLAAEGMRDAGDMLTHGKSDAVTQHVQRQIVSDLDKLIAQAKKSAAAAGQMKAAAMSKPGAASKPASQPSSRSIADGHARKSDPNARHDPKQAGSEAALRRARAAMKDQFTAELPAHQRERMLELPSEDFLPKYQLEIEDYFRRMSERRPEEESP